MDLCKEAQVYSGNNKIIYLTLLLFLATVEDGIYFLSSKNILSVQCACAILSTRTWLTCFLRHVSNTEVLLLRLRSVIVLIHL